MTVSDDVSLSPKGVGATPSKSAIAQCLIHWQWFFRL